MAAIWLAPLLLGLVCFFKLMAKSGKANQAFGSAGLTAACATAVIFLSVRHFQAYGLALFIGLPVACGILPVLLLGWRRPITHGEAVGVTAFVLLLVATAIIFTKLDGLICILMAAPLALVLSFTAAFVTNFILRSRHTAVRKILPLFAVCLSLPFLVGFEVRYELPPPSSEVTTTIDIAAPAAEVWKFVPSIPEIPGPPEAIFRAGLAYPIRSDMLGSGVGALRRCVLSTGAMKETVTIWEPGRRLRFDVTSCPPSMKEFSIYSHLHTAHLDNFMVSEWGEFDLIPLDATHTRLMGTSRYHNKMWPSFYWLTISDWVVHRIHTRVLQFIKSEAEKRNASMALS